MMKEFLAEIKVESKARIKKLHHLGKRIWEDRRWSPVELRNKCLDKWDDLSGDLDCAIIPLVSIDERRPVNNLIFGSGSFSTGRFQAEQYEEVKYYTDNLPIKLQGIIANKSQDHNCQAKLVSEEYKTPLIELDFSDWYHQFVDKKQSNPIRATRYWYNSGEENIPSSGEINRRFKIRQDRFQ